LKLTFRFQSELLGIIQKTKSSSDIESTIKYF